MRRLVLFAALGLCLAGCGDSLPGGKVVTPTPVTVVGTKISTPWSGGDATEGKSVFQLSSCGSCHTFTPAGSKGATGPSLDQVAAYAAKAHESLDAFLYAAITSPPAPYVPPGYPLVMPTTFATSLTKSQIADLVAFLAQTP